MAKERGSRDRAECSLLSSTRLGLLGEADSTGIHLTTSRGPHGLSHPELLALVGTAVC